MTNDSSNKIIWRNFFVRSTKSRLSSGHLDAEKLADKIEMHSGEEAHHCVFDLEPRDTFKDYIGIARPALGLVHFDFDSKEDLGVRALEDVKAFVKWLGIPDYALSFSGRKGFVVGVPEKFFGIEPSSSLPLILTRLALRLKEQFPTLDTGIYSANHKLRVIGTRHPETGLFKIQLIEPFRSDVIEGKLSIEKIRELAGKERGHLKFDYLNLSTERTPIPKIIELINEVQEEDETSEDSDEDYTVDSEAVKNGCEFLKSAKQNPNSIDEAQWFAMLTVVGRLENGRIEAHSYSEGYKDYSHEETDQKLERATQNSKPRTCKNINTLWGKCGTCSHFGKVRSPISIRGENFIPTKGRGFHREVNGKKVPAFDDLLKYFDSQKKHITISKSKLCFIFNGKFYEFFSDAEIEAFAQTHFNPFAKTALTREFSNLVHRTGIKPASWFVDSSLRKMNFKNGILDIDSMKFTERHSPEIGFRSVLNFDYNQNAECPTFNTFMKGITCEDESLEKNLLEFMGYAISNDRCQADKVLILTGEGENGKSRFLNILAALGGSGCIPLSPPDFRNSFRRQLLDGALFSITEEMPAFKDKVFWEDLKGLASGKKLVVEKKNKDPYDIENRAKFIFSCNELPEGTTPTHGYFRKLLIVPFNQVFSVEKGNRIENIDRIIIESEMSGVMNRVLEAYKRLQKQKYTFTESFAVRASLENYKTDVDSVYRWFKEHVEVLPSGKKLEGPLKRGVEWLTEGPHKEYFALVPLMYSAYANWCEHTERDMPVKRAAFTRRLMKIIPDSTIRINERKIDGKKVNSISGVTFHTDDMF